VPSAARSPFSGLHSHAEAHLIAYPLFTLLILLSEAGDMKPKQSQPRRDKLTESFLFLGVRPIFLVVIAVAILFLFWILYRMLTA
jgi:hypothetical protein